MNTEGEKIQYEKKVKIRKNIGRIFRQHNIIEYKSPEDHLNIDDFYKVYGYTCIYKTEVEKVNHLNELQFSISWINIPSVISAKITIKLELSIKMRLKEV